jgi:DNA-binding XRE family transcriptional regulator
MIQCLGEVAREARVEAKCPRLRLANALGVDPSTIIRFEQGKRWPRDPESVVTAYAECCGVDQLDLWRRAVACLERRT